MRGPGTLSIILISLTMLSLVPGCAVNNASTVRASGPEPALQKSRQFTECLDQHLTTHPAFTAQDVYKFAHQSVAGPGHLVPSEEKALAYLQYEIANLKEAPEREPLYEELGGELDLVRLNLRPYVKRGGDPQRLVEAMQITAASVTLDTGEMSRRLRVGAALLSERGLHKEHDALVNMLREYASRGYPALHHSERFGAAYHPAYRVISRNQADTLAGYLP